MLQVLITIKDVVTQVACYQLSGSEIIQTLLFFLQLLGESWVGFSCQTGDKNHVRPQDGGSCPPGQITVLLKRVRLFTVIPLLHWLLPLLFENLTLAFWFLISGRKLDLPAKPNSAELLWAHLTYQQKCCRQMYLQYLTDYFLIPVSKFFFLTCPAG